MLLDALAITGWYPRVSSTGNVINVPDPTTVLIVPAHRPAIATTVASMGFIPRIVAGRGVARVAAMGMIAEDGSRSFTQSHPRGGHDADVDRWNGSGRAPGCPGDTGRRGRA